MATILLDEEEERLYDEEVGPEPTTRHPVIAEWGDYCADAPAWEPGGPNGVR